jgi:hypothetical protein
VTFLLLVFIMYLGESFVFGLCQQLDTTKSIWKAHGPGCAPIGLLIAENQTAAASTPPTGANSSGVL